MKTKLFPLLLAIIASIGTMHAAIVNGTCGENLTWTLNTQDSTLIIEGSGEMTTTPWAEYMQYISHISLPEGLVNIEESAFSECSSIDGIDIPSSVTNIESKAFYKCTSLKRLQIPDNVVSIGSSAFNGCSSIEEITIPNGIIVLEANIFYNCSNLKNVTIPNSVEIIEDFAFGECSQLLLTSFPDSLSIIGEAAFSRCRRLKSLTIPKNVTSIGAGAFRYCDSITEVTWNAKNCKGFIKNSSTPFFYISKWGDYRSDIRSHITSFTFGDEVETIPSYLCWGLENVESFTIPENVKTIQAGAFEGCSGFTEITIPNNVSELLDNTFMDCNNLRAVTFGNSIAKIGNTSFTNCPITHVRCLASIPPSGGINSGIIAKNCKLDVPEEYIDVYANSIWWEEFSLIRKLCTYYWVKFVCRDGELISCQYVDEGENAVAPIDFICGCEDGPEMLKFIGWDKEFNNITSNLVVTAIYEKRFYVRFNDWDGSLLTWQYVAEGGAATPPANPTREGYTFVGWDKDFSNVTEDMIVTAQYEEIIVPIYSFNYKDKDGLLLKSENITLHLPEAPEFVGFTFLYWSTTEGNIENGITIVAIYEADETQSTPDIYTNPSNSAQKLIRNGNVYILMDDSRTYTLTGQEVR